MADLIERQAAIDEIDEWIKAFRENGHKESAADACLIQDGIIQLPSVDVQPIVRCKDCKHWDASDIHSTICPNNRRCKGIIGKMYTAPDHYCAFGERKDV